MFYLAVSSVYGFHFSSKWDPPQGSRGSQGVWGWTSIPHLHHREHGANELDIWPEIWDKYLMWSHGRPHTFFQGRAKFSRGWGRGKNTKKDTIFLKISCKTYYFGRPGGRRGQGPPLALPLRTPICNHGLCHQPLRYIDHTCYVNSLIYEWLDS